MASQSYTLDFDGYWREANKSGVPNKSGIYCVYSCTHDAINKTVSLKKLIYIGQSDNVNSRLSNHEKLSDWGKHTSKGEVLCYSFAPVLQSSIDRCEAALIFKHKPPVNSDFINSFPFDQTTIVITGKSNLLSTNFVVNRN